MSHSWPDPTEAAALFQRLLAGDDPLARSDFVVAFLDPLVVFLRATHPGVYDHDLFTAAEDALLSVMQKPSVFDPTRSKDLATFLKMAATGDLKNVRAKERRHQRTREDRDCVELEEDDGKSSAEGDTELPSFDDPQLAEVIATFSDAERIVFELMRSGERQTAVFAVALGLGNETPEQQARLVQRVKNRIVKRFQRAGGRS